MQAHGRHQDPANRTTQGLLLRSSVFRGEDRGRDECGGAGLVGTVESLGVEGTGSLGRGSEEGRQREERSGQRRDVGQRP